MLHIAFMIGQLGYGGSEKQLYSLLRNLDPNRFHAQVWVVSPGGVWEKNIREIGVKIINLGRYPKFLRPFVVNVLARQEKIDIWWSWSYFTNLYAHFLPRSVKRIGALRIALQSARKGVGILYPWYESSLDLLICNSKSVLGNLVSTGYHGMAAWVGNIADCSTGSDDRRLKFRRDAGCGRGDILIIGVGSLFQRKNYIVLLEAIADLPENIRLAIIGDGPERGKLEKQCRDLSISHRVWMPCNIPNASEVISYADLFVHPSIAEGMPNVVLEAAIAGIPIVVTDVDGVRDILNASNARIIPVNDTGALTHAIQSTIDNYVEAKAMATKLKERVSTEFHPSYVVNKLESWIDWLTADTPCPAEFGSDL
jgi:glycosyltransferase involved in cell wall biosynthesis